MTTRVQTLRSSTTGAVPAAGTRTPGELWTNFSDLQMGVIDASKNPQKLVAVRYFSTSANYATGDFVIQAGALYVAKGAITAGAFNATQWTQVAMATDVPTASGTTPSMDGTAAVGTGTTYARADHVHPVDTSRYAASNPSGFQTAAQVTASLGAYLPLAGGTLTGPLTVNANATFNPGASGQVKVTTTNVAGQTLAIDGVNVHRGVVGTTGGLPRWQMVLGNAQAESGANAGSDFYIARFADNGALIDNPFAIMRATGQARFIIPAGQAVTNLPTVDAPAGSPKGWNGATNGLTRWQLLLGNATAESGANAGSNFVLNCYNDAGAPIASVMSAARSTGIVTFTQPIVNGPSDRTLKDNIAPLEGSLDKILALQGVSFNMLDTPDRREIGLIAQDVAPVVPEILQEFQMHDAEGRTGEMKMALDYPKLVALLIEAVKTLSARVEALEATT